MNQDIIQIKKDQVVLAVQLEIIQQRKDRQNVKCVHLDGHQIHTKMDVSCVKQEDIWMERQLENVSLVQEEHMLKKDQLNVSIVLQEHHLHKENDVWNVFQVNIPQLMDLLV